MTQAATRLTCYALLTAIESDLRDMLLASAADLPLPELLAAEQLESALKRFSRETGGRTSHSAADIVPFLDYQVLVDVIRRHAPILGRNEREFIEASHKSLTSLTPARNRVAHARPLEISDLPSLIDMAESMQRNAALETPHIDDTVSAIERNPSYVLGLEIKFADVVPDPSRVANLPAPDFDETGFIGRSQQVSTLKRRLKGAWPVVTIVGDGGVGKTALAVKLCYDILDDPGNPYEAIVWSSAKTTMLTVNEIKRIENSVSTSLGLISAATAEIAGDVAIDDPFEELLQYMEHFKVLLVLDNLETVLDDRLRNFLSEVPLGSKVLITSRIGFGTLESIRLESLSRGDAVALFRSLSKVRNVPGLSTAPQSTVDSYLDRMGDHPLYIKWFVSAVEAGKRPEDVLASGELLDFCMSNVYQYLSNNARTMIQCMQTVQGSHSQGQLAHLSGLDITDLQEAVLMLITTNFVLMNSVNAGSAIATEYEISEFAWKYLEQHHPVPDFHRQELLDRQADLIFQGRSILAESKANPYVAHSLDVRGEGYYRAASVLRSAITQIYEDDYRRAAELINDAKVLSPDFHECHRIEASLLAASGNIGQARAAFKRALELMEDSAPLWYFYGEFLDASALDGDGAVEAMNAALAIDPEAAPVLERLAAIYQKSGLAGRARDTCRSGLRLRSIDLDTRVIFWTMLLASYGIDAIGQVESNNVLEAVEILEEIPNLERPSKNLLARDDVRTWITHLIQVIRYVRSRADEDYFKRVLDLGIQNLSTWLDTQGDELDKRKIGRVVRMIRDKNFGFVRSMEDGLEFFFHAGSFDLQDGWLSIELASLVTFEHAIVRGREQAQRIVVLA